MKLTLIDGQEIEAQVGESLIGLRVTSVTLDSDDVSEFCRQPDYVRLTLATHMVAAEPTAERYPVR